MLTFQRKSPPPFFILTCNYICFPLDNGNNLNNSLSNGKLFLLFVNKNIFQPPWFSYSGTLIGMCSKLYSAAIGTPYTGVLNPLFSQTRVMVNYMSICIIMILCGLYKPLWLVSKALLANFIQWPFMALKKPLRPPGRHL